MLIKKTQADDYPGDTAHLSDNCRLNAATERHWQRAQRYLATDHVDAARVELESTLQRAPEHTTARVLLAGILLSQSHVRAAAEQLLLAADRPTYECIQDACNLALALLRVGEVVAARKCMAAIADEPGLSGPDTAAMARVYQTMGEHEAALEAIERTHELGHSNAETSYFRSVQLMFNSRLDEAESELETCLRLEPAFGRATLTRARLRKQTMANNHLTDLNERLRIVQNGGVNQAAVEFALFKELDDLGETRLAWEALERGNALMQARLPHAIDRERQLFDRLLKVCTPQFLQPSSNAPAGASPIFIIGLPRSGTTVLERMLGNHAMIRPAGELPDFPRQLRWQADVYSHDVLDEPLLDSVISLDYANIGRRYLEQTCWRAHGKHHFVDKLPSNFQLAGFIHRALPQAPILHLVREPMAVCFSNYKALFGDAVAYSYSLQSMAAHHAQYQRLMEHWHHVLPGRILDVPYAELIDNPEAVMRRLLNYCRLPYDAQCLDISRNTAPVATLSTAQVRESLHRRALVEWRRYECQLDPLRRLLSAQAV